MTGKMAFANLFTRLSAVDNEVKGPAQTASTHRNERNNGKRANSRKRKCQDEQTGPFKKKQSFQAQMDSYKAASFEYSDHHMQNTDSARASSGFTDEVIHNQTNKPGNKDIYRKGQNYKAENNNHSVNKQQQQTKKMEGKKYQHQMKDRRKHCNRGSLHRTRKGGVDGKHGKQNDRVKPTKFMTQEFKDENALILDGQLICRHFLWGRCIKGDNCQLKHIQGYNDLVKEVCKFYVQGFCMKGESCPYMHKSFPCKFFHRKGKCSQGADCRFSHEPLNEVTNKLLDEALKRERDLYELTKKAEQEPSGQRATTDEAEITDTNQTPDVLIQPFRPSFYNSEETNAEQEASLCQAEEWSNNLEEAVPSQTPPQSPQSVEPNREKPICYSVEAVLGRPIFKLFPTFLTTPQSQESTSLSVEKTSECIPGSANQSEAAYSVDAVLKSCKSMERSTFCHTATSPAAQTISYTPKTDYDEVTDHGLSSKTQNEKVLCSVSTRSEASKSQEYMHKSPSSLQVHTGLIANTCPDPTLESEDLKKQGELHRTLKPAQRISHEVNLEFLRSPTASGKSSKRKGNMKRSTHLPTDITCSVKCKSGGCNCKSLICFPKHPTQLKPHALGLTSNPEASVKPPCPSPGFSEFKSEAVVFAEPVTSSDKMAHSGNLKQSPDIHQHSKETEPGLRIGTQQQLTYETAADCSNEMAHCGDLSVGRNETQKRPFHGLFASLITDSPKPTTNSLTIPASYQSSCSTGQSALCTSKDKHVKTAVEPDKTSTRSFLSLFAAPLSADMLPCMQPQPNYSRTTCSSQESEKSVNTTSHLSDSKQRGAKLETPLPCQVKSNDRQTSHWSSCPKFSTSHKRETDDDLSETVKQCKNQQVSPTCSLVSDSLSEMSSSPAKCVNHPDLFTTQSQQQQPSTSSHKGTADAAASTRSVLKTLFLRLSPYQQDGQQQDDHSNGEWVDPLQSSYD